MQLHSALYIEESAIYFIVKTAHILFATGWLACVFVLPRVILHWKIAVESGKGTEAVEVLSLKLFRFGLLMFLLTLIFGVWLWQVFGINGTWLNMKLLFVGLLIIYFGISGWLMFRGIRYQSFLNIFAMRVFNEFSLFFVIPIIYLAVSKNA